MTILVNDSFSFFGYSPSTSQPSSISILQKIAKMSNDLHHVRLCLCV